MLMSNMHMSHVQHVAQYVHAHVHVTCACACCSSAGVSRDNRRTQLHTLLSLDSNLLRVTAPTTRAQGNLLYLGRADAQVKIRGYRVELEDIETHLTRLGGSVALVAAVQRHPQTDAQELVAFIAETSPGSFDVAAARNAVRRAMPTYCMPSAFLGIRPEDIPTSVTSNKVMRDKLPHWSTMPQIGEQLHSEDQANEPNYTLTQRAIFQLLDQILGVRLALDDRILDHGLNSVSGAAFISACRKNHGWSFLKMRDVYQYVTIAELAQLIDTHGTENAKGTVDFFEGFDIGSDRPVVPAADAGAQTTLILGEATGALPWNLRPRPFMVAILQALVWIALMAEASGLFLLFTLVFELFESFVWEAWHMSLGVLALLLSPVLLLTLAMAHSLLMKWCVIGTFRESDVPLYSLCAAAAL
jgi:aryl carrier-like protein